MRFFCGVHFNICAIFLSGILLRAVPARSEPLPATGPVNCELDSFCSCTMSNGSRFDLTPLKLQSGQPYFQAVSGRNASEKYAYDPCIPFSLGSTEGKMECANVAGCRMERMAGGKTTYTNIAKHFSVSFVYDPTSHQAFLHYINEELLNNIRTEVQLECLSPKAPTTLNMVRARDFGVVFKLSSPKACLINPDDDGPSGGSILCILFSVCFIVYLVGGILVGVFVQNKPLSEAVPPNRDFWLDLPALILDGVKFTMNGFKVTSAPHRRLGREEEDDTNTYHDDLNDEEVDELKVQPSKDSAESTDGFSAVPV